MRAIIPFLFFTFFTTLLTAQVQIGQDIDGESAGDFSGWSVSMPDNYTVAIGATGNDGNGVLAGHVRIFNWNGTQWIQKGTDIDGFVAGNETGYFVNMPDSNTVAISSIKSGVNRGHVRIYTWNGSNWIQKGNDFYGDASGNNLGNSVSMPNANTIAIGAPGNGDNGPRSGLVRIYTWNGSTWTQKGQDINGAMAEDRSGYSVSMPDSNTIAIGAVVHNYRGHVRIYTWNGSNWVQKGSDIDGESTNDYSGWSVCMPDSSTVAIGAPWNDGNGNESGHVRVYHWNGNAWVQKGQDINGEDTLNFMGHAVSMPSADLVAVSAPRNNGNGFESGHVQVYRWDGNYWVQVCLDMEGESVEDYFGASLSMPSTNTLAVGAHYNDGNGNESGHVKVFKLKGVYGKVYKDYNQNCMLGAYETGLENKVITINPGNIVVQTNQSGNWKIDSLPAGTYSLTVDTTSTSWQISCPNPQSFVVSHVDSLIAAPSFGFFSNSPCPAPNVSIHAPFLRPGFSNQKLYLQICNDISGTATITSAYIIVSIDTLLTVTGSTLPYINLGNNRFRVNLGDLAPGQCTSFYFNCTLSVDATLGQTLCMQADLYPLGSCVFDTTSNPSPIGTGSPCNTPWDLSSLLIEGICDNDSICFTIYNTGDPGIGDMTCFLPVRLYIDGQFVLLDSVQLNGGQSTQLCFAGDGRTWRLEVDQHPLHPGNSQPNATIELCGNANNWNSDLVNILPADDADPVRDIYCGVVTGSYDPNDKTGYPLGRDSVMHYIYQNEEIEYRIRFQNTGTDTAFTVVIRDTLPQELDIFSVRSGVSSHAYDFRMYGPRVLEWTFNNILLPDSTTNEPESHGFVKFKVKQQPDLSIGTVINNKAGIYFDFNPPIITNTYHHTVDSLVPFSWDGQQTISQSICDSFEFRGYTYDQSGIYYVPVFNNGLDSLYTLDIDVFADQAKITWDGLDLRVAQSGASYQWLDCDNGNSPINGATSQTFSPTTNGNYAVEISTANCTVVSPCFAVANVSTISTADGLPLRVYPNPTRDELVVELGDLVEAQLALYDARGRLLRSQLTSSSRSELDVKALPAGLYLLRVQANGQSQTVKVVKR